MVKLFYMEEGVWLNSDMAISFTDGKEALNEFSCTITLPPFESGEQLHYYIAAVDDSGAVVSLPIGAPRNHFTTKIGYQNPKLYINEFLASNDSLFADNFGEYDDWLEIYNGDSESINLKGFYLSDNFANPGKWAFPDTVIESGGFMLLWADEDQEQGPLHLNFKLSRNGEQLGIFNSDTTNFAPVDTLTFDLQVPNISFGRYPDGTLTWEKFDSPTPGSANQTTSIISDNTFLQPSEFRLDQNYPNPFNPVTAIGYRLSAISQVELSVYNLLGQKIAVLVSERQNAGSYQVEWDASGFTSGIYFYRLQTDLGVVQTRKLMLIK